MSLFQLGKFTSAANQELDWKIECDALTDDDWECIANVLSASLKPFGSVYGVPTGGKKLADKLIKYITTDSDYLGHMLIVDDVWTTGYSMMNYEAEVRKYSSILHVPQWQGAVAFARAPLPLHISCFAYVLDRNKIHQSTVGPTPEVQT